MSVDMSGWSETKKKKYAILSRAFQAYRGWEAILLIQWRIAAERHIHDRTALIAAKDFNQRNEGQPQAVRALNLLAERDGQLGVYKYNAEKPDANDEADDFLDEMELVSRRAGGPTFN